MVYVLNESSRSSGIFDTEFVQNLLGEFWEKYHKKLFWNMFIPFVLYMIFAISFMYVCLYRVAYSFDKPWYCDDWVMWTLGIVTSIFWTHELYLEII